MRRSELEHVLRAACEIAGTEEALVIGSQAILGAYPEDRLPLEAFRSIEVDLAFFDDENATLSDRVDGSIGELSRFHEMYGYYAQGVGVRTAVLPSGWRERLIPLAAGEDRPVRGLCLEPHDLVASKLVAFRGKDQEFAAALLRARLVDAEEILVRISQLDVPGSLRKRISDWVRAHTPS